MIVKKDKKQGNKDHSHMKCFDYHKKDHYDSKCPNWNCKKPKSSLATFALMTWASKKSHAKVQEGFEFQLLLYIKYPIQFDELQVVALINSGSEVNVI